MLISHASKVMIKILPDRLQQYMNQELPNVQAEIEKAEEPEIKLPKSTGSQKQQRNSRKNIYYCFTDNADTFDCVRQNKLWKILKDKGIADHLVS